MESRKKNSKNNKLIRGLPMFAVLIVLVCIVLAVCLIDKKDSPESASDNGTGNSAAVIDGAADGAAPIVIDTQAKSPKTGFKEIKAEAQKLSMGYDYDGAIELLKNEDLEAADKSEADALIKQYEAEKETLVRQEPTEITHIFFHSLIIDTDRAFDGEPKSDGYNQVMTTETEFRRILAQMYERGYVLVSMHDMCYETKDPETGKDVMVYGDIYLPPGKKAFIMSQDDVCYYEYQRYDGFALRMVVGEDGRPTCEYKDADGNMTTGEYDIVPILDRFIDEHPDFSYKGAKAVLAFTGYNGILGYRTDETYAPSSPLYDSKLADAPNENIEADRKEAVKVLKALVDDGYELASHSWGHLNMGTCSFSKFTKDADRWDKNVNSLIREATGKDCDIMIYPNGSDIGAWKGYAQKNINCDDNHPDGYERFCYYHNLGFRYYCNVDSAKYFVQKGNDYMRQARRNVDGYRMWKDITEPDKAKLSDLIDVKSVFDSARPTPVPEF